MKTIYLISCCKEKLPSAAKAKDLYQSEGFKRRLAFAKYQKADEILILSAKHHIVELDQILEPYDVCLSNETVGEQKKWAEICIASLKSKFDLTKDKFFILAAEDYYKYLIGQNRIENYELPYESEITKTQPANNSNFSKLYSYLSQTKKSYCDDCLSKLTGISPRQQINQLCNKNSKVIHRDDYCKCFNCSKYKIVRFI